MKYYIDEFLTNHHIFLASPYFSHLPVFSYKSLRLCRESLMLLEYHEKKELSVYIKESTVGDIKTFGIEGRAQP
jgi:hypothetical protein